MPIRHRATLLLALIAAAPVFAARAQPYYGEPPYRYAPPGYYAPYAPPPPAYYAPYVEPRPLSAPTRRRPPPKPRPVRTAPHRPQPAPPRASPPTPFEGPGRDATPPPPVALMPELPMARPDPDQPRRRISPFTE